MQSQADAQVLYASLLQDLNRSRALHGMDPIEKIDRRQAKSIRECAEFSILDSIIKKWVPANGTSHLEETAIAAFLESNESCRVWDPTAVDPVLLTRVREILQEMFYTPDIPSWEELLRSHFELGPGASVLSHGQNSFYEKLFVNPVTVTDRSLFLEYDSYTQGFPLWRAAELQRRFLAKGAYTEVQGSNLSTVRKNSSTDRTICTEPSLNMIFQKALGQFFIDKAHERYGFDPSYEANRNRRFCKQGSIDGKVSTLDLKNASDRIPLQACELLLGSYYSAILDCRSPRTQINGKWTELFMVSSMGNGFTFPLMSVLIHTIMEAVLDIYEAPASFYDLLGCWGDDIVCPTAFVDEIIAGLESFNFLVNKDKSFTQGHFRESCGEDYFKGVNVRGVYIKSLDTPTEIFSAINRLNKWSAIHRIALPSTVLYLLGLLGVNNPSIGSLRDCFVPADESDIAGIKVPASIVGRNFFVTYHALVPVSRPFALFFGRVNREGLKSKLGVLEAEKMRASHNNPCGALLSLIAAELDSSGIRRSTVGPVKVTRERRLAHTWNRIPKTVIDCRYPYKYTQPELCWLEKHFSSWEAFTWINLGLAA